MYRLVVVFGVLLLACGCFKKESNEQAAVTSNVVFLPIVAIVPVIDSAKHNLDWNLSEELSELLLNRLTQKGNFYLTASQKVSAALRKASPSADPFSADLSWVRQSFYGNEFVVFAEIVEHEEMTRLNDSIPLSEATIQRASADLNISLRLRVVDLRRTAPKIVLQEMLHVTHHVPRQFTRTNFYQVSWGSDHFHISPLGLAHTQLVKTVTSRLEDYILRATDDVY